MLGSLGIGHTGRRDELWYKADVDGSGDDFLVHNFLLDPRYYLDKGLAFILDLHPIAFPIVL